MEDKDYLFNLLGRLSPINEMNDSKLRLLCNSVRVAQLPANQRLDAAKENGRLVYCIEGAVSLMEGREEKAQVAAHSKRAASPIFTTRSQWIVTKSAASILRVERNHLDLLLQQQRLEAVGVQTVDLSEAEAQLLDKLARVSESAIEYPVCGLEEISRKIIGFAQQPPGHVDANILIKALHLDPVLMAYMGRHVSRAKKQQGPRDEQGYDSPHEMLEILGEEQIISALAAMENMPMLSASSGVAGAQLANFYKGSARVGSLSFVFARDLSMDTDRARLYTTLSGIGVAYVLSHVEDQFEDVEALVKAVNKLKRIYGIWCAKYFALSKNACDIVFLADSWQGHSTHSNADYLDVALVSSAIAVGTGALLISDAPSLKQLPATRKFIDRGVQMDNPDVYAVAAISEEAQLMRCLEALSSGAMLR